MGRKRQVKIRSAVSRVDEDRSDAERVFAHFMEQLRLPGVAKLEWDDLPREVRATLEVVVEQLYATVQIDLTQRRSPQRLDCGTCSAGQPIVAGADGYIRCATCGELVDV